MKTSDKKSIKIMNRVAVFSHIKNKPGQTVSRPEIAKTLHITDPTVLKITSFFEELGILREIGEAQITSVGRKPSLLSFVPDAALSIGMDYDGNRFSYGVVNLNDETTSFESIKLKVSLEELFEQIIPPAVFKLGLPHEKCMGLGLSLPAVVNTETCMIEMRNPVINLGDKNDFADEIRKLERNIGMPVFLENDVNAAAIAQTKSLKENNCKDFIYIMLGFGLGAGIVFDGKLRRGARYSVGEIGYMTTDLDFETNLEKSGWLETQLEQQNIAERFSFDILNDTANSDAGQVLEYVAEHIAFIIANLSAALDVNTYILGGIMIEKLGDPLIGRLQKICDRICVRPIELILETSPDVIVRGMGAIVNEKMLSRFLSDRTRIEY